MSRNLIYAHFIFSTKKRQGILLPEKERELFAYIMGITNNLNGKLVRINAALNHVHILVKLPTTISFADYIATIKRSSSIHTVSPSDVERVKMYVANQKEHHKIITFEDELLSYLPADERTTWDWKYLDT